MHPHVPSMRQQVAAAPKHCLQRICIGHAVGPAPELDPVPELAPELAPELDPDPELDPAPPQTPPPHVCPTVLQFWQARPDVPHCVSIIPVRQVPPTSQQPEQLPPSSQVPEMAFGPASASPPLDPELPQATTTSPTPRQKASRMVPPLPSTKTISTIAAGRAPRASATC